MDNFFRHARAHTLAFQQPETETETYLATVHLVVRIEPGQAAEDAVSMALSEILGCEVNGCETSALVDWAYAHRGPTRIFIPSDEEGSFLDVIPSTNRSV